MEGTRTNDRGVVEIADVFVDYDSKEVKVMGPITGEYELFGIKLYACGSLKSNQLLAIDSRGKGTIFTLKEEEMCRLIRED